jgi:YHS domain-containing protein
VELPEHIANYFAKRGMILEKDSGRDNVFGFYNEYVELELKYNENEGWGISMDSIEIHHQTMICATGIPTDERFDILMACLGLADFAFVPGGPTSKVCTITNGEFAYSLKVDGKTIYFQGNDNAEYFKKHYQMLGYLIQEK